MHSKKAQFIAELIKHLDELDGEELMEKSKPAMTAVEIEIEPKEGMQEEMAMAKPEKGPMDELAGEEPLTEDEIDDDELEELAKLA